MKVRVKQMKVRVNKSAKATPYQQLTAPAVCKNPTIRTGVPEGRHKNLDLITEARLCRSRRERGFNWQREPTAEGGVLVKRG